MAKALNLLSLFVALTGIAALARKQHPESSWAVPVVFRAVLATSQVVITFTDFTMTDVPFPASVVGAMLLWGPSPGGPHVSATSR